MHQLTPDEARLLGVLIEKSLTTPDQYPLSLNAAVNGANQKNNRDPVLEMSEDAAFAALESLRANGLAVRVDVPGNRVHKYRHNAGDTLHARTSELAILAELLLRGPQTLGELRGRASRMSPFDSLDVVRDMLRALMERPEPLVKELPPSPGSRAERFTQLLCLDSHPIEASAESAAPAANAGGDLSFASRIERLETEVAELKAALQKLAQSIGEPDPLASPASS